MDFITGNHSCLPIFSFNQTLAHQYNCRNMALPTIRHHRWCITTSSSRCQHSCCKTRTPWLIYKCRCRSRRHCRLRQVCSHHHRYRHQGLCRSRCRCRLHHRNRRYLRCRHQGHCRLLRRCILHHRCRPYLRFRHRGRCRSRHRCKVHHHC